MRRIFALVTVAAVLGGCGPSLQSQVRDDWQTVDRAQVRRLAVVAAPQPEGDAKAAELWALVARRYVNQHRDFIVKRNAGAPAFDLAAACTETTEGALHLQPTQKRRGDEVEVTVVARLLRCRDGVAVWSGSIEGAFASDDEHLRELADHYARELGAEVKPLVAPVFRALRALLDTLPQPELDDEAALEKIELGE